MEKEELEKERQIDEDVEGEKETKQESTDTKKEVFDDSYIDDIIDGKAEVKPEEQLGANTFQEKFILSSIVEAFSQIGYMLSEMTEIQAFKFSEEDKKQLTEALRPFASGFIKYIQYLKYVPIIVFGVGYIMRIMQEIKTKKKLAKESNKPQVIGHNEGEKK